MTDGVLLMWSLHINRSQITESRMLQTHSTQFLRSLIKIRKKETLSGERGDWVTTIIIKNQGQQQNSCLLTKILFLSFKLSPLFVFCCVIEYICQWPDIKARPSPNNWKSSKLSLLFWWRCDWHLHKINCDRVYEPMRFCLYIPMAT